MTGAAAYKRGAAGLAALLTGLYAWAPGAEADALAGIHYDPAADALVVTLLYQGTNPDHTLSLQWGPCGTPDSSGTYQVPAEVLDSQWDDPALDEYQETVSLSLAGLPCRPAEVTLRTPPKFHYTVYVPRKKAVE